MHGLVSDVIKPPLIKMVSDEAIFWPPKKDVPLAVARVEPATRSSREKHVTHRLKATQRMN